jgi:hypothetical protein
MQTAFLDQSPAARARFGAGRRRLWGRHPCRPTDMRFIVILKGQDTTIPQAFVARDADRRTDAILDVKQALIAPRRPVAGGVRSRRSTFDFVTHKGPSE